MVAAQHPAVRAELVVLVLLEGARHARTADGWREPADLARLVPALADAVEHGVRGLEDSRAAVEHGAQGVGGEQQLEAGVAAEVAEGGVQVRFVAPDGARRTDLVDQPVLVVSGAAVGARRLEAFGCAGPDHIQPPTHRHWLRSVAASAVCHSWSGHASQANADAAGW